LCGGNARQRDGEHDGRGGHGKRTGAQSALSID
jgi:hypothetical protein